MTRGYSSIPDGICDHCGTPFPRTTHHPHTRFCSKACSMRFRRGVSLPPPNPSGLCMCGCGNPTSIATRSDTNSMMLEGHPIRYLPNHQARSKTAPFIEEDMGYETPCWVWQRALDRNGYGSIRIDGRTRNPHRIYWEQENGPVPEGLELDHLCRVRSCIRPTHLEPVTSAENQRRGNNTKVDVTAVATIRDSYGSIPTKELAARFGITAGHVHRIAQRKAWGGDH